MAAWLFQRFRYDPHRRLDANLDLIASYVAPQDVLIDVGGGAGRLCFPMALRCREGIVVDVSQAMEEAFQACAATAGITNARFVRADWLAAEELHGDIVVAASVTYFVRDIVAFVRKLEAAARRRVLITVRRVPGPNLRATLFRLVYGEEKRPAPGYRELLPVLWEMGIRPDVRVLPGPQPGAGGSVDSGLPQTRAQAVEMALQGGWLRPQDRERARGVIEAHDDALFSESATRMMDVSLQAASPARRPRGQAIEAGRRPNLLDVLGSYDDDSQRENAMPRSKERQGIVRVACLAEPLRDDHLRILDARVVEPTARHRRGEGL